MAIKIKPDYAEAHNNLGGALVAEGKNEEAISHFKMAIKIKPDYARLYNNLGNALLAEQKTEEAISQYKMAINLKPDYAKAYHNLGVSYILNGRLRKRFLITRRLLSSSLTTPRRITTLGLFCFMRK